MAAEILAIGAAGIYVLAGLPYGKIDVTETVINTDMVQDDIRMCIISDLHCRRYGRKQAKLIEAVKNSRPDFIVMPGDMFDTGRDAEAVFELIEGLKDYPMFYVTGNHEGYMEEEMPELLERLRSLHVNILENEAQPIVINNQLAAVGGLFDMGRSPDRTPSSVTDLFMNQQGLRILLSHRPYHHDFYSQIDCDLIVSGHAHGGQWRLPFGNHGLFAPGEGFFPKYTSGIYECGDHKLFVSRGLASGNPFIPRLYNNPEINLIIFRSEKEA